MFVFYFAMMRLTLLLLLLIAIWPPIASVTAIDEHDDPRNIQARIFRVEARADYSNLQLW